MCNLLLLCGFRMRRFQLVLSPISARTISLTLFLAFRSTAVFLAVLLPALSPSASRLNDCTDISGNAKSLSCAALRTPLIFPDYIKSAVSFFVDFSSMANRQGENYKFFIFNLADKPIIKRESAEKYPPCRNIRSFREGVTIFSRQS